MKIIFTCGGSAGHINPAVSLARLFMEKRSGTEVLFVGAKGAIEEKLIPKENLPLKLVTIGAFRRSMRPKDIKHNVETVGNLRRSQKEARKILEDFQPDLVVGTGGFASYPVVREAARQGIPTAIHESNVVPGLTTTRLAKFVDLVMVGFEEAREHYKESKRVEVTGTPIRGDFLSMTRKEAKKSLGLPTDKPLVLSYWGSLGASRMNHMMVDFLAAEVEQGNYFYHMHSAGRNYESMVKALEGKKITLPEGIYLEEYIYNMPQVMAAADLVLCRAGASTLSELTALGRAAILVPSPYVTNHHQEKNAMMLEDCGGAVVCLESETSGTLLYETTKELLDDPIRRQKMSYAMEQAGTADAAEKIYESLISLLKPR